MADYPEKIRLNLDTTPYTSKDNAKRDIAQIRQRLRPIDIAPEQLVEDILQGYTFCPAELTGTTADTWVSQQLFCLDIDNDDGAICTPDDAAMILFERDIMPLCIYYSFSHTTDHPKFRVLILADTPVKDADQAQRIRIGLIDLFAGRADGACKDGARLFFGTNKGVAMKYRAWTTPISMLDAIAAPVPEPISEPAPAPTRAPVLTSSASTSHTTGDDISLVDAINEFDLAAYIERTTHTQPRIRGHQKLFNPCPICGHNDDFYVDGSRFICFGAHGLQGGGGNVINYLEHVQRLDRRGAREYFLRDILGIPPRKVHTPNKDASPNKGAPPAPTRQSRQSGKPYFKIPSLENELKEKGIEVKFNQITGSRDVFINGRKISGRAANEIATTIYSDLCDKYQAINITLVSLYLTNIAEKHKYNPVLDLFDANQWDGQDHLSEIYDILNIAKDDQLSRTLLLKWFWQGHALLRNDEDAPYGADGVLVLTGAQGIGKTSFFAHMAIKSDFFRDGQKIKSIDKDTSRRCITTWIAELGELDATFKAADISELKAFITKGLDQYRLPYASRDEQAVRRANLAATVNTKKREGFLVDTTGNRRFWTVPVDRIDLAKLKSVNALQVWLQVWELYAKSDLQGFRLTPEEREMLNQRNKKHEKRLKAEEEIRDILAMAEQAGSGYTMGYITVSQFKVENDVLKGYSVEQIGKALDSLGIEQSSKRIDGKKQRVRLLPKRAYSNF